MIFPIFQKTSLVFHIVPIHVLQCTPVVLEICNVLLVLKKVDTNVTMVLSSHGRWWFDDEELVFQCN